MEKILYPVTKTIVPTWDGFSAATHTLVKKGGQLYPVTHKFITKADDTWLDDFDGGIIECFNWLPFFFWGAAEPHFYESSTPNGLMYGTRTLDMAFAYMNFGEDFSIPWVPWSGRTDVLGNYFVLKDETGSIECGNYGDWYAMIAYYLAHGGGRGIVISPNQTTDFFDAYDADEYGHDIFMGRPNIMPTPVLGPNSNGVMRVSASVSTSGNPGTFGFFHEMIQQNFVFPPNRGKDMVLWLYQYDMTGGHNTEILTPDTSDLSKGYLDWVPEANRYDFTMRYVPDTYWPSVYLMGDSHIINDDISEPGTSATRVISNKYKYAPWERYPNLL